MRRCLLALAGMVMVLAPAAAQHGASWVCSAPNLVRGEYSGGTDAYIHLSGFSRGSRYAVQQQGRTATGVTANGTRFTCRQQ